MLRRSMSISFKPLKNNYVILPESYFRLVAPFIKGCLQLTTCGVQQETMYMTWAPFPGPTLHETEIGLNATAAAAIGLKEGAIVKCSLVKDTASLSAVHVIPASESDWRAIEASASQIQNTLLEQARIVNRGQALVVWLNKSITVTIRIDKLVPDIPFGRLGRNTELIVAPTLSRSSSTSSSSRSSSLKPYDVMSSASTTDMPPASRCSSGTCLSKSTTIGSFVPTTQRRTQTGEHHLEAMLQLRQLLLKETARVYEFRVVSGTWDRSTPVNHIFIRPLPGFDFDRVYLLRGQATMAAANVCTEYLVNVRPLGMDAGPDLFPDNMHLSVLINENLLRLLGIREFEKVVLRPKTTVTNFVEQVDVHPSRDMNMRELRAMEQTFKKYVIDNSQFVPLLLNQNQVVALPGSNDDHYMVTVKLSPDSFKYCLLDADILSESKIRVNEQVLSVDKFINKPPAGEDSQSLNISLPLNYVPLERYEEIICDCVDRLKFTLGLDQRNRCYDTSNILIVGGSGCGKSVLCERIVDELLKKPFCCYFDVFYCSRAKGRKPESLQKDLRQFFVTCAGHSPAVLIIDNMDVLAKNVSDNVHDADYCNKVSEVIKGLIKEFTGAATHPLSVIATVANLSHLNRRIYSARGEHLFQHVINLPDMQAVDRQAMLRALCHQMSCSKKIDWTKVAASTEGYVVGDLLQLAEKAIFAAYRHQDHDAPVKCPPVMTESHIMEALRITNSYCLQGIESGDGRDSEDEDEALGDRIPGLESAIDVLEEVIQWPARYPGIYEDSPLRNQAGVLLYGPPGTGKTFLVSRLTKAWGLRLISVKGPELLAKYIGQSEENVRNLFDRARKMRPCVLFFDEFDSLAPRRGHDSTGVTDRVVNQLLTELDGVESLQGVTVIAATSRPELLDPALLRSGRIDRLVECHLPNAEARLAIYEHLCKSITLNDDVDLKRMAAIMSDKFTGADIRSVVTSANMIAVKEYLERHEEVPDTIVVTQGHFKEAVENTRPSLTMEDMRRYQRTYAKFTNKEKKNSEREFVAQRATLA